MAPLPIKTPQTAVGFDIDKATTLTPAERRLYQDFIDTEAGGTKTADNREPITNGESIQAKSGRTAIKNLLKSDQNTI